MENRQSNIMCPNCGEPLTKSLTNPTGHYRCLTPEHECFIIDIIIDYQYALKQERNELNAQ